MLISPHVLYHFTHGKEPIWRKEIRDGSHCTCTCSESFQDGQPSASCVVKRCRRRIDPETLAELRERKMQDLAALFEKDKPHVHCLFRLFKEWSPCFTGQESSSTTAKYNVAVEADGEIDLVEFGKLAFKTLAGSSASTSRKISLQERLDLDQLFNTLLINPHTSEWSTLSVCDRIYKIPPSSQFHISDLNQFQDFTDFTSSESVSPFDLIVMDPPWSNKSVRRSNKYREMDCYDLFKIPMKYLCHAHHTTLVAIWVTNNPKFVKFVLNKLLPDWNLTFAAEWFWFKMKMVEEDSDAGRHNYQLVSDLDSHHRKPYERLIIATSASNSSLATAIPNRVALFSIPSAHSRKPPVNGKTVKDVLLRDETSTKLFIRCYLEILEKFVPDDSRKLELFARNLLPGWTSWGNETIKFNDSVYL